MAFSGEGSFSSGSTGLGTYSPSVPKGPRLAAGRAQAHSNGRGRNGYGGEARNGPNNLPNTKRLQQPAKNPQQRHPRANGNLPRRGQTSPNKGVHCRLHQNLPRPQPTNPNNRINRNPRRRRGRKNRANGGDIVMTDAPPLYQPVQDQDVIMKDAPPLRQRRRPNRNPHLTQNDLAMQQLANFLIQMSIEDVEMTDAPPL